MLLYSRIIIVGDEPEIVELLRLYLENEGHETIVARDGEDVYVKLSAEEYDLAIDDIMMPRMDGFELIQKIRGSLHSKMPILAVSEKTGDSDKILGPSLGADDYIAKPFIPMEEGLKQQCYGHNSAGP